ncbi:MAG: type II toxin-antitoxin system HicA family toxin [Desulfovibrionaceae bacterium]|nr:type II toxin-antitoxin system HicA family toxin [Desulfovibrionaceae bacterium]MBF0513542.1 type II toxin-antitoxin system HicA family toxin [Desulfovibrionaceae bacterium]
MNSAELLEVLKEAGFEVVSIRGSHHKLRHPDGRTTVVPHPKKDLGVGLVNKILKKDTHLK